MIGEGGADPRGEAGRVGEEAGVLDEVRLEDRAMGFRGAPAGRRKRAAPVTGAALIDGGEEPGRRGGRGAAP